MKHQKFGIILNFAICSLNFSLPGLLLPALLLALSGLLQACSGDIFSGSLPRWGIGGRYNEGREQFLRGRGGNMDTAVEALQSVVKDDPTYKDSMTLLARAYYRKGYFDAARQVSQRALLLNKDDEIAWLVLGLAQLRVGEDEPGMETLGGAITLASKASRGGYRNFPDWDSKAIVRTAVSRAVVAYKKGLEEKEGILRAVETILLRMDDEENFQRINKPRVEQRGRE
ncbi:MAG: hypothetical protein A3F90_06370 [Deltaproteobacteria bacterium RIFCSPLOWO2_12_FULL_60_19]|nr:MAG: hypothetical protein A3F90_06370 [Deltaproteobacteria bacterium RIFCSPLOWO2_12_FULL_60_19]